MEGVLNVWRFCREAPWPCAGRKLPRRGAWVFALLLSLMAGVLQTGEARAQATAASATKAGIDDTWQGTLMPPGMDKGLRTVLKISKAADGALAGNFYSIDQGGQPLKISSISFQGGVLKYGIDMIDLSYEGKMSASGNTITGSSTQGGNALPLVFTRSTPETAWSIPEPRPRLPPMAADADPSFEVATIKPTKPDEKSKMLVFTGHEFKTVNISLMELITFSYGVQAKQLVGAPAWMTDEKFDVTAVPDVEGSPNAKQLKTMVRKLVADRFRFTFHHDKKELSVYVLSVAKTGPKMTKSDGDANSLPGFMFPALGTLNVQNSTMGEFISFMQEVVVDRPMIDQTELAGKWSFKLKWTPDDSQFGGMGARTPPSTESADAAPNLYTAIEEQVGLKLDATRAPADVLVIDHVERPSAN